MANLAIFEAANVRVSRTVALIAGVSYPIGGIVSVSVRRPNRGLFAAGLLLAATGLFSAFGQHAEGAFTIVAIGAVLALMGWRKPSTLMIATAGAERVALRSGDAGLLEATRDAIVRAVTERG